MALRVRISLAVSLTAALAIVGAVSAAPKQISAGEAKDHVGETATVCGTVVSAKYARSTRGSPTFLNLDEPYPSQVFTIVIWGADRARFGEPEKTYDGKRICVTGLIKAYRGKPEVVATDPGQLKGP